MSQRALSDEFHKFEGIRRRVPAVLTGPEQCYLHTLPTAITIATLV